MVNTPRDLFRMLPNIYDGTLKIVNYLLKKTSTLIFNRVLNTPLTLYILVDDLDKKL